VALVTKIPQIILRELIYLLKKLSFLVDRLSARAQRLAVEYSLAVIYDIL